jgi:hypothetical protein
MAAFHDALDEFPTVNTRHDFNGGYARKKTGSSAFIHFGPAVEAVLRSLPIEGLLFPRVA